MSENRQSRGTNWAASVVTYACISLVLVGSTLAEDLKGRWYFGGNLSFLSTTDYVRSNAAIFLGDFGDDGLPGTSDPNEDFSCEDASAFCDPRPDDTLTRSTSIEETFKYDVSVGYGITSWLSLQLDASYFRADVGPVDAYVADVVIFGSGSSFIAADRMYGSPLSAGEITEIPVSLTAIARFRKDSTLNPYVGVGAGAIFAEVNVSPDVASLNSRLASLRIRGKSDEFGKSILVGTSGAIIAEGKVPLGEHVLSVAVDDAFEYHLTGGGEYFFNDRMSLVFDARYTFADQDLQILLGSQDQVDFTIISEGLFRADESLKYFRIDGSVAPNPFCSDSPNAPRYSGSQPSAGGGCPMVVTPLDRVKCAENAVGDFDGDGVRPGDPDVCYLGTIFGDAGEPLNADGKVVVQGGRIDLTGFSIAMGVRFHF